MEMVVGGINFSSKKHSSCQDEIFIKINYLRFSSMAGVNYFDKAVDINAGLFLCFFGIAGRRQYKASVICPGEQKRTASINWVNTLRSSMTVCCKTPRSA